MLSTLPFSYILGGVDSHVKRLAAEAVARLPDMSNRAIAEEIGVSEPTVRRMRLARASCDAPEKVTGKDGKARRT